MRIAMGQVDSARQMLDTATKGDPDLIDAWVALAWANTIQSKDAEAQKAVDEAAKRQSSTPPSPRPAPRSPRPSPNPLPRNPPPPVAQ